MNVFSCLTCSKTVPKKSGRRSYFYCSHNCQHIHKRKLFIEEWKSGKVSGNMENGLSVSRHVRQYLFEKYDHKCCRCGWDKINPKTKKRPLQVNHIDGNGQNTVESNLELLCPNCHSLTSTFGGANRGKGRPNRVKHYIKKALLA